MIMMLPFLTGTISIWLGVHGQRRACLWFWAITMAVFLAWSRFHMTDPLTLSF
ncbi:DUF5993 family protein [Paralcaligenes ureilyticus]|uniref:Uncharacterized protein n=1 Tax=Paralcaligenes ureilyticus TaxID=627131 RepID=A0A4R3M5M6_9BURK|nr:DUF5993 family protein [Paralcaligenes ureilyticus]TCT08664.1 hypothetical protein EDC26_105217 [Paralcaligenes ureilyticus]